MSNKIANSSHMPSADNEKERLAQVIAQIRQDLSHVDDKVKNLHDEVQGMSKTNTSKMSLVNPTQMAKFYNTRATLYAKEFIDLKDSAIRHGQKYAISAKVGSKDHHRDHLSCILSINPWSYIMGGTRVITRLSDIHSTLDSLRMKDSNLTKSNQVDSWVPPSSFQRSTHKYWVQPAFVPDVMANCVSEVPILVYGKESGMIEAINRNNDNNEKDIWDSIATNITSVYFDSPKSMVMYNDRIARVEAAQLFRIRWYGAKPSLNDLVFLELKTHHEQWVENRSVKERVCLRNKDVSQVLLRDEIKWTAAKAREIILAAKPQLSANELDDAIDLLLRIRHLVIKKNLQPCVRSSYRRVAFQSNSSNALRFTIDRDVQLSSEVGAPLGAWCLEDHTNASSLMLPVAIFEVKLNGVEAPVWVDELMTNAKISDGHKFSKYLTGASALLPGDVPSFPYWASDALFQSLFSGIPDAKIDSRIVEPDDTVSFSVITENNISEHTQSKWPIHVGLPTFNLRRRQTFAVDKASRKKIASKQKVRIEPKTYFAAERTFIQWISVSLLLTTMGALLFAISEQNDAASGPRVTGLILTCVAIFIATYALAIYFRRLYLMKNMKPFGYTDHIAPVILTVACLAGVGSILYFTLATTGTGDLGGKTGNVISELEGQCTRLEHRGISPLVYQPSDIAVDRSRNVMFVPSDQAITAIGLDDPSYTVEVAASITGADIEGLVLVNDILYAVTEDASLYAYKLKEALDGNWNIGDMESVGRWELKSIEGSEGIAFEPDGYRDSGGKLLVASNIKGEEEESKIFAFDLPTPNFFDVQTLNPLYKMNSKILLDGIEKSPKISAMQLFEGALYVLYDNARVIRAFDLTSGTMVSEISLPCVGDKFDKQWEGMFFERISSRDEESTSTKNLRGKRKDINEGRIQLHLALDTPASIWTFTMVQTSDGKFEFPLCAAAY